MSRALNTDLYQLTMAAGYFAANKQDELATFEFFVRRMPENREYLIAAGLEQAIEYLHGLSFDESDIAYLQSLRQFSRCANAFWDYLRALRFTGELWAMPEGTAFFPNEPILTIKAPIIQAQLVETFLLATVGFQSMIASKAARLVALAQGKPVVEFGTRRAHSPRAGVLAGRAAYIGGCAGTSNVEAGKRFGIPVYGTCAHSWVLSFEDEREAFERMQQLLGEGTVQLIDTYDTVEGAHKVAALGQPLLGVRLDSGDTVALARAVRKVLDAAQLQDARIMVTGDLDEHRIREILNASAPVDSFGVGTHLAVSADAPSLNAVYKLVEHEVNGVKRYPAKLSPGKATIGGAKQVYRLPEIDLIARMDEQPPAQGVPLLQRAGASVPTASQARAHSLGQPRHARHVVLSPALATPVT